MTLFILALFFLLYASLAFGMSFALSRMGKGQTPLKGRLLFLKKNRPLLALSLPFLTALCLIGYALTAFAALDLSLFLKALSIFLCFAAAALLFQTLGLLYPKPFLKLALSLLFPLLLLFWPLASFAYRMAKWFFPKQESKESRSLRMRDKILEILQEPEFAPFIDSHEQKLVLSLLSFKERIAREIMIPRIDMFCLSKETPIREAADQFLREGYSRIPVFDDTVDNVVGVVHYKDVFNHTLKEADLATPIAALVKPTLYTPETKPISKLLQEFRSKQMHLAIVVDEYGGTEGLVTIEDILEELVGEIADEYDKDEEALFTMLPSGDWIVDAKMAILDIEEELGIKIPSGPEYDTLGGYIFHKAGAIPSKGWRLHHDDFEMEVLSSSERAIEKVRIQRVRAQG